VEAFLDDIKAANTGIIQLNFINMSASIYINVYNTIFIAFLAFGSVLTLWELAYDIFVPRFQPKNRSFRLLYQRPSSSADCARELFNGSNRSASLLDALQKNFLVGQW